MLFNSLEYVLFFVAVWLVYWTLGANRWRHRWLLMASLFFYGWWDWRFLGLILTVIFVSYLSARKIAAAETGENKPQARRWLIINVVFQLLMLGFFKYTNFFIDSLAASLAGLGIELSVPVLSIILPVGISFYIFQALSYVVDVYRGTLPADPSFTRVALYVSFFPQLVAGPIVRGTDFFPQLDEEKQQDSRDILNGLRLFLIGFAMKTVFSDNLSPYVDEVFSNLGSYDNESITQAALGFYSQIYFDFAGYSLMAIGVANMFGFRLPDNFTYPYRAASIGDFWRRWHRSLSFWLRDYLYIPLGGNRGSRLFQTRNLMLTMLLGGLWHGASWNFVLWGGLHGGALCTERAYQWHARPRLARIAGFFKRLPGISPAQVVFSWLLVQVFVLACWVPFRAGSFEDTMTVYSALLHIRPEHGVSAHHIPWMLLVLPIVADTFIAGDLRIRDTLTRKQGYTWVLYLALAVFLILCLLTMYIGTVPFIYFQF